MPPRERPPRRTPRSVVYRRRLLAVAVLAAGFAAAWFAVGSIGGGNDNKQVTTTAALPPKPFRIVFPEGFTRAQMAARVAAVDQDRRAERGKVPRLTERAYLAATRRKRLQPGFGNRRYPLEGFLFPATYDFTGKTTGAQLETAQLKAFRRNWAKVNLGYARSKNLTRVRRADDRLDDRARGRRARGAGTRRRGHLQPPPPADAARDRCDASLRAEHPADGGDPQSQLDSTSPYNRASPRPAADADREPGARLDPGGG